MDQPTDARRRDGEPDTDQREPDREQFPGARRSGDPTDGLDAQSHPEEQPEADLDSLTGTGAPD